VSQNIDETCDALPYDRTGCETAPSVVVRSPLLYALFERFKEEGDSAANETSEAAAHAESDEEPVWFDVVQSTDDTARRRGR